MSACVFFAVMNARRIPDKFRLMSQLHREQGVHVCDATEAVSASEAGVKKIKGSREAAFYYHVSFRL